MRVPGFEIVMFGSPRDLELRAQLEATSAPAPELSNDKDILSHPCPTCGVVCTVQGFRTTLLGYSSPKGHNHNYNCKHFSFTCPSGHSFSVLVRNTCPAPGCTWKGQPFCLACGNNVLVIARTDANQPPHVGFY